MPEQVLKEIFPLFSKEMHNAVVKTATAVASWHRFHKDQDSNLFVSMTKGQKPMAVMLACADSRMGGWVEGRANEVAQVLQSRLVGAIATKPVDINSTKAPKLLHEVKLVYELGSHYGNELKKDGFEANEFDNVGHDGCGHHGVAFTYHMLQGGKKKIRNDFGAGFVQQAKKSKYLVQAVIDRVNKFDLRYYRDLGFDFGCDTDAFMKDSYKFPLAMTIEQTEFNRLALEATKRAYDNNPAVKNKLGLVCSKIVTLADEKFPIRLYSSTEGFYVKIPSLDHSLIRQVEASRATGSGHAYGCGCHANNTCVPK